MAHGRASGVVNARAVLGATVPLMTARQSPRVLVMALEVRMRSRSVIGTLGRGVWRVGLGGAASPFGGRSRFADEDRDLEGVPDIAQKVS